MNSLPVVAQRVMFWTLVPAALAAYIHQSQPESATKLATRLHATAAYIILSPRPKDLSPSIFYLGEFPNHLPKGNIPVQTILAIKDSDLEARFFVSSAPHVPRGHQPKGIEPLREDSFMRANFIDELRAFRLLAAPYPDIQSVAELDRILAPSTTVPFTSIPTSREFSIVVLAIALSCQLLYLLSVLRTIEALPNTDRELDRSWIYYHHSKWAKFAGDVWIIGPSIIVYFASVTLATEKEFSGYIGIAVPVCCWLLVAFAFSVQSTAARLRFKALSVSPS